MRALVLSGGGPLAVAWESGLAAGLTQGGMRLPDADIILGTSAGAIVGAQLAAGVDPGLLAQAVMAEGTEAPPPGAAPRYSPEALAKLTALFAKAQGTSGDPAAARAEVGAYALSAPVEDEDAYVARVTAALSVNGWPERSFGCVAVDAEDGRFKVLSRDCCAELGRAVAASCSLPGLTPPVRIGGRRYMDGGLRSAANADLAEGYDVVLVFSFQLPGAAGERMAARVAQQVDKLHLVGAAVLVITPDAACLSAIGPDSMDVVRRPQIARAAAAQGQAQAQAAVAFWNQRSG